VRQADAYFWGIITMMSAPFLVLGTIGLLIWLNVRRQRRLAATAVAAGATAS